MGDRYSRLQYVILSYIYSSALSFGQGACSVFSLPLGFYLRGITWVRRLNQWKKHQQLVNCCVSLSSDDSLQNLLQYRLMYWKVFLHVCVILGFSNFWWTSVYSNKMCLIRRVILYPIDKANLKCTVLNIFLFSNWLSQCKYCWLLLTFCLKILGVGGDLWMAFCQFEYLLHSYVVGTLKPYPL